MGTPYEPLPQGGTHTRVLHVCADSRCNMTVDDSLTIPASLHVVDLERDDAKFIAISYTWLESPVAAHISLQSDTSLPLDQNVLDVIESVRRQQLAAGSSTVALWIDALCINQQDVVERALQVSMMGRIYSSANCVLAWLGPGTFTSRAAFSFVNSVAISYLSNEEEIDVWENFPSADLNRGLRNLLDLLSATWFQRTWVIQEVTLGKNVVLMCGDDVVDLYTFQDCVYQIWIRVPLWDLYDTENNPALRGLYSVTKLLKVRREFHRRGAVRLEILLEMAYFLGVTDRRDSVHGFRAICSDETQKLLPTPDYTIPVDYQNPTYQEALADLFQETSAALLCNGNTLNALALAGSFKPSPQGFPTWAIYIRHDGDSSEPFVSSDASRWHAGGPEYKKPEVLPSNQLRLAVKILDHITHRCKTFTAVDDLKRQEQVIAQVPELWDATKSSSRNHHSEQLAYDLVLGLDSDDFLAGPEIVDQFKEYLQWLKEGDNSMLDTTTSLRGAKGYHQLIETRVGGWRVFITNKGYLGIGPKVTRKGDVIAIVPGCRLPLIFRPVDHAEESGLNQDEISYKEYTLVSWCYMRGLMRARGHVPGEDLPETEIVVN